MKPPLTGSALWQADIRKERRAPPSSDRLNQRGTKALAGLFEAEEKTTDALRNRKRCKVLGGVKVVFTRFINDTDQAVLFRTPIADAAIELPPFEGRRISVIANAQDVASACFHTSFQMIETTDGAAHRNRLNVLDV